MSRVIKNNDGVAVVEGTPAASLIKDIDKFFALKPPERMAGEGISKPKSLSDFKGAVPVSRRLSPEEEAFAAKLNEDRLAGIQRTPEEETALRDEMFRTKDPLPSREAGGNKIMSEAEYKADATRRIKEGIKRGVQLSPESYSDYLERQQPGYEEARKARIQEEFERYKRAETSLGKSPSVDSSSRRNEAKDKAEFRRVRSKMESERSQEEQEATKGKFITTLGR